MQFLSICRAIVLSLTLVLFGGCAAKHDFGPVKILSFEPAWKKRLNDELIKNDANDVCWIGTHFAAMAEPGLACPDQTEVEAAVVEGAKLIGRKLEDLEYPIVLFVKDPFNCSDVEAWGCRTCSDADILVVYWNHDWKNSLIHELLHSWLWFSTVEADVKCKCDKEHAHEDWAKRVYPAFR